MTVGIYAIENIASGKLYLGKSVNVERRWKGHIRLVASGNATAIHNALRKYGVEAFKFYVVEVCTRKKLDAREKFWIRRMRKQATLYNETAGGDGGAMLSEASRKKISEKAKSRQRAQVAAGTHFTQTKYWRQMQLDRAAAGENPSQKPERRVAISARLKDLAAKGEHPAQLDKNRKATSNRLKQLSAKGKHAFQRPEIKAANVARNRLPACWVNNGTRNKRISPDDADKWLKQGWVRGIIRVTNRPLQSGQNQGRLQ